MGTEAARAGTARPGSVDERVDLVRGCPICADQIGDMRHSGIAQLYGESVRRISFLYVSRALLLIPGPGSLSAGYMILAPRGHYLRFAELGVKSLREAQMIMQVATEALAELGPYVIFEHGSGSRADRGSACVVHAHLHLLPVPDPERVHAELEGRFDSTDLSGLAGISSLRCEEPYLFVSSPEKRAAYHGAAMESQLIRKLAASQLGIDEEWNWRTHPRREQFLETLARFVQRRDVFDVLISSWPSSRQTCAGQGGSRPAESRFDGRV